MRRENDGRGCSGKESFLILAVAFLFIASITAVGVSQFSMGQEMMAMQRVTAADYNGPRIVGGFVPEQPLTPEGKAVENAPQEPIFLSWEFINGLFAIIILLEFVIFPILFWLWFGPSNQTSHYDAEEDESASEKK